MNNVLKPCPFCGKKINWKDIRGRAMTKQYTETAVKKGETD